MDPIVLHVDGRTEIANGTDDFPAVFCDVDPNLCHLLLELHYYRLRPWGRGVFAIPCDVVYCVQALFDAVDRELLPYYFIISPY